MCYERTFKIVLILAVVAMAATAAAGPKDGAAEKVAVIDGSVVHDVGRLHLNVTNWGLLGSQYTMQAPFSDAPSGRWPGAAGIDHLWGAGLWVGGVRLGERLVTTGLYDREFMPTEAPEDTIYRTFRGAPHASRYPLAMPDDDGDGLEDEDPPNGRDDDGDGAVDEDGAGIGDQHFRCEFDDTRSGEFFPEHTSMDLAVVQRTFQWADDDAADFVGVEYTIRNAGAVDIEDLYLGMFSDFDINDPLGDATEATDDQVGFWSGMVQGDSGAWIPVDVGYAYEGADATVSGYMGWVFLGYPTDQQGVTAPSDVSVCSFQRFSGNLAFEDGGDPINDSQRYELMASDDHDTDSVTPDDYRILLSAGPFAELAAGEEITVSFALVAGADRDEMLQNAARAKTIYEGEAFDRDGNPSNGAEFVVRWLGFGEGTVGIQDGGDEGEGPPSVPQQAGLSAAPNPFNPSLEVKASLPRATSVRLSVLDVQGRLVRVLFDGSHEAGDARWTWNGRDASGQAAASGVYLVRMETPERVLGKTVTLVK